VSHDAALAARIRALLPDAAERRMFGGIGFMVGDRLAVAASGQGGVLVRVDPAESDELVRTTDAEPMVMRGRTLPGWLRVPTPATDDELENWVARGVGYARSLAPG